MSTVTTSEIRRRITSQPWTAFGAGVPGSKHEQATRDHARIAARLSASAIARAATSNAVTIAAGRRSAACTSTPTMRGGRRGTASGPARTIANAWTSSSTVTPIFPTELPVHRLCLGCDTGRVGAPVSGAKPPALGREPFPLMQGRAVAKLAMKASCRHYLHEPRRRPQSTFIVVRHMHFLGNRGFGVRNELCSHIDYSPLSLGFKRRRCVSRGLAAVENRILAYRRTAVFPPFRGFGCPARGVRAGEPPPTGVLCGLLSPQCQRARWTATRRAAR